MKHKIAALALVLILIVNIVMFAMGLSSSLVFWMVIIIIALISYFRYGKGNIYKQKAK